MIPDPKREPLFIATPKPRPTVAEVMAAIAAARRRRSGVRPPRAP